MLCIRLAEIRWNEKKKPFRQTIFVSNLTYSNTKFPYIAKRSKGVYGPCEQIPPSDKGVNGSLSHRCKLKV